MSIGRSPSGPQGWNYAALFAASGFVLATWGARLPSLRHGAELTQLEVGALIAALAGGTLLAMIFAGRLAHARGPRWCIALGWRTTLGALLGAALLGTNTAALIGAALLLGASNGIYDVGINTMAGQRARRFGEPRLMPWAHGFWSVGALCGAGTAALFIRIGVPLGVHLVVAAAIASYLSFAGLRNLEDPAPATRSRRAGRSGAPVPRWPLFAVWSPRTISLGLLALGAAAAESTANEWLTLAVTDPDGYHADQAVAAGLLGCFVIGMVVTRFASHLVLRGERFERGMAMCTGFVTVGTALVILGGTALAHSGPVRWPVAVVGLLLWGCGAALGVPVAMSLAAKKPREHRPEHSQPPERVSAILAIGYGSFVVFPLVLSLLGEHFGMIVTIAFAPIVMISAFGVGLWIHPRGQQLAEKAAGVPQTAAV